MREYQRKERDLDSVVRNLVDGLNKKQSTFKCVYAYPEESAETCNNTRQAAQVQELDHVKSLISDFKAKQNERLQKRNRMRHVTINNVDRTSAIKL